MPKKRPQKKKIQEDEPPENTARPEKKPQTFDEYHCSGNVQIDFPALCALLNVKEIPAVWTRHSTSSTIRDKQLEINSAPRDWSKPCLEAELENENPLSTKEVKVSGWKVDEQMFKVLLKVLPSIRLLHGLHFWQAGLKEEMLISLMEVVSLSASLRSLTLEGNVLPNQSFHLLLPEGSVLTHLSLRNNRIGDEGARLIGAALSTTRSANSNLLSLNLAFNSIGDAGAVHIAQGLRFNRTLLYLSLCNNHIGDSGAADLATILGEFALTHEEVVERRKLLLQRKQAESLFAEQLASALDTSLSVGKGENKSLSRKKEASRKDEELTNIKEKSKKKSDTKGRKSEQKEAESPVDDSSVSLNKEEELVERVPPLLEESVYRRDGQLFLPGNSTLESLNLAGNRITEKSLPLFLKSLEMQEERGGLLRLCLQRNLFPPECECYMEIKNQMELRLSRQKQTETTEEEETVLD
ncbi:leucine-rich repeat-containing protein 71 [Cololabis saira]|uniref:leucine-rich repeat-containing protein 71 n=1 Tax=Cololabis saira TaxID=129043 RepID=UPI002AD35141|nr:leucine-rich repeat-containing protein 71 [Cololabis saira]